MNQFLKASRKKRRVLAVDDELINRELIEAILSLNYDVTGASNGKEAMELLYKSEEPYSLILLDLLMPQMSGFQVLEACKADERLRNIPIIVMTSEKSAEVRSIRMGADDFISKPYRMPEVILARCERIIQLSEEKKLIRSIEKDEETGLYIKLFFDAYIRRALPGLKRKMDAVVLSAEGAHSAKKAYRHIASLIREDLAGERGIACRCEDDLFCAFVPHHESYDEIIASIQDDISENVDPKILIKAGIVRCVDTAEPIDEWFKKAKNVIDTAGAGDSNVLYEG